MTDTHEVRHLRRKVKELGKQNGKSSATIYALRNEAAALREAVTWNPGDRARLYNEVRELNVENRKLREQVEALTPRVVRATPHPLGLPDDTEYATAQAAHEAAYL